MGVPDYSKEFQKYDEDGLVILKGFASDAECDGMRNRMNSLIEKWDPETSKNSVFSTHEDQQHTRGTYFIESAETVSFFLEQGAVDEAGELKKDIPKAHMVNKVGHKLHVDDDVFAKYSMSKKMGAVAAATGLKKPVVPQSMYIFKQPKIGGEVTCHQDSTFFWTEPKQTVVGIWLALEDADEHNGCRIFNF